MHVLEDLFEYIMHVHYNKSLFLDIFSSQINIFAPPILLYTVFIRIVSAATINFSLAWVRLLIEGGSYSRAAFINFGPIPHSVIRKNCSTEDWFMKTSLRVINVRSSTKLLCCSRTKPRLSSAIVLPERASAFHLRS